MVLPVLHRTLPAVGEWFVWHALDGALAGLTLGCVLAWLRARSWTSGR
jgi:NhaP-type Na+/H+ or K+/H+ antiporter